MLAAAQRLHLHGSPDARARSRARPARPEGARPPLPKPAAILIASAHWETTWPMLTGSEKPETIHDFYNFPEPFTGCSIP